MHAKHLRTIWKRCLTTTLVVICACAIVFATPGQPAKAYSGYQFPCGGYGVSGYSFGQWVSGWGYHVGEDVCSGAGRAVYAAADGTVVYSAKTPDSYRWGNLIMVQHDNGDGSEATTIYGHLSNDRRVGAGQTVSKGQLLGFTGPSFTAENGNWAAHLHFAVKTGAYGASVGTYAASINGYRSDGYGPYAHPTNYVNGRVIVNDYQLAGVDGHGAYPKNGEYYVEFRLKNTGTSTWRINGANPMRLGTIGPNDRGSSFSVGMLGHGWAANNRIALMEDTAPGQVGVFRARFNNTLIPPGYYVERFAPVIEGQGWLANKDLSVGITVQPPRYAAQWAGQNVYTAMSPTNTANPTSAMYLLPGQRLNVKAYVRNVGDYPWKSDGANPVRLATTRPNDRGSAFATGGVGAIPSSENWPWYNRPSGIDGRLEAGGTITPTGTINPGEVAVFSFAITAPNQPGTYNEYFNPVIEGVGWLNDIGMYFPLRVLPPGNHYEWVTQSGAAPIQLGRSSTNVQLYLRNIGQSNWSVGGNVRLGTDRGMDRASAFSAAWSSPNRAAGIDANMTSPGEQTIYPGNVARFNFNVQTESLPDGTYNEYFRPVADGVGWMPEDYGMYFPITVSSPARDYKVVSQTFDRSINDLRGGDQLTAQLAVRNLGTTPWNVAGANPVRLATSRPDDRGSGFNSFSNPDPWLAVNRPSNIDGKVVNMNTLQSTSANVINQSEIAYLNIPLKIPHGLQPGPYNEYFNFVQEGQSWFPDLGIYFPLNVVGD